MTKGLFSTPLLLAAACVVVGVLAALGKFNSMFNFPWIFALACLAFGLHSLWRQRPRQAVAGRAVILLAGAAVAVGGWLFEARAIEARLAERQQQILAALQGRAVPDLSGLEPLNTERETWDEAAALSARATIVAFWARWCSPCWKEMPELEELYQQHRDRGLQVVAITSYDRPQDEESRRSEFAKAQEFLRRRNLTYPAAITDNDDIYRAYEVRSLPSTVLVDQRGRVVDYALGLKSSRSLMQRAVVLATGPTAR